jgi:predicted ferric reductase
MHPSNVLELRILNKDVSNKINYKAGQYVYLNLSTLSYFEWHPFTITSGPYDKYLTGKFIIFVFG